MKKIFIFLLFVFRIGNYLTGIYFFLTNSIYLIKNYNTSEWLIWFVIMPIYFIDWILYKIKCYI